MKLMDEIHVINSNQKNIGRPIDNNRTQIILQAVGELVIEKSIAGLSMEGIAKRAKVSKVTLYRRFGDLESLIRQYVQYHTSRVFNDVPELPMKMEANGTIVEFEQHLNELGYQLMKLISRREVVLFDNAIAAAVVPFPDIGLALYQAGPERAITEMSQLLQAYSNEQSCLSKSVQSAESLFSLWKSGFYDQLRMTGIMRFNDLQLKEHVKRQTGFFIASWRNEETLN